MTLGNGYLLAVFFGAGVLQVLAPSFSLPFSILAFRKEESARAWTWRLLGMVLLHTLAGFGLFQALLAWDEMREVILGPSTRSLYLLGVGLVLIFGLYRWFLLARWEALFQETLGLRAHWLCLLLFGPAEVLVPMLSKGVAAQVPLVFVLLLYFSGAFLGAWLAVSLEIKRMESPYHLPETLRQVHNPGLMAPVFGVVFIALVGLLTLGERLG